MSCAPGVPHTCRTVRDSSSFREAVGVPVVVNAWEKNELMVYFQNHSHSQVLTRTPALSKAACPGPFAVPKQPVKTGKGVSKALE